MAHTSIRKKTELLRPIRRILSPDKYVSLKTLCEYAGVDLSKCSQPVQLLADKIVHHVCTWRMGYFVPNSVYHVTNKDVADYVMSLGALVLVSNEQYGDYPCIITPEPIKLIARMCGFYRFINKSLSVTMVSGSIGKSTTKGMLNAVYSRSKHTFCNIGDENDWFSVAYSVQHIPQRCKLMIQETHEADRNMNDCNSEMLQPNVAVITTIDYSHVEKYNSQDELVRNICMMTNHLKHDGIVVIDKDNFRWYEYLEGKTIVTVSIDDSSADYYAQNVQITDMGIQFDMIERATGTVVPVRLNNIFSKHNVVIALKVFAASRYNNISYSDISKGLSEYRTGGIRQNIFRTHNGILVYADCFNSVLGSVKASIESISIIPVKGKRIAVIGDIEELGAMSESIHNDVANIICTSNTDILIAVGEKINNAISHSAMRENMTIITCQSAAEASVVLKKMVKKDDLVLLKASHSIGLDKVIKTLWPSESKRIFSNYEAPHRRWLIYSAMH